MEEFVSAYKHQKTGRWYLFIEEIGERLRLLDGSGGFVILPISLFDDEPEVFDIAKHPAEFTIEQLAAYQKHSSDQKRLHEMSERAAKQAKTHEERAKPAVRSTERKKSTSIISQRVGVAATWSGAQLTFYRPQIDRLGPKQSFRVQVDGVGEFVISKADFLQVFSDVVLSPKYKQEGFFAYTLLPEKARRFLVES